MRNTKLVTSMAVSRQELREKFENALKGTLKEYKQQRGSMNISELRKKLQLAFPDAEIKQGDAYQDHVTVDFGGDHGFFVVMEDDRNNYE